MRSGMPGLACGMSATAHARGTPILPNALHGAPPAELRARIAAERAGHPFLLFRDGDGCQRIVALGHTRQRLTIGRSAINDIALCWDIAVSRIHGHLEWLGEAWTFVDDGLARNGSFVDGERVSGRTRLADGCAIRLGGTVLLFRSPAEDQASQTAVVQQMVPKVSEAQLRVLTALCRPCVKSPLNSPAGNREIADELVIGFETVKSHMKTLFELFGLDALPQRGKRAALVQMALSLGIVPMRAPHA